MLLVCGVNGPRTIVGIVGTQHEGFQCMGGLWCAVAQWLERATDDRVVAGSNPAEAVWKLGNFLYPTLPVSFRRDTKSRWPLLSGVYARGSERSHTGGKGVTCRGLYNSTWSIMSTRC